MEKNVFPQRNIISKGIPQNTTMYCNLCIEYFTIIDRETRVNSLDQWYQSFKKVLR